MTSEIGPAITILAADTKLVEPVAAGWQLILAAAAGIALIVVLITVAKLHPFLALIFGAITVGIVAGQNRGMSSTRSARDSATRRRASAF
jgi:GntP family gluconate:H+ symporter